MERLIPDTALCRRATGISFLVLPLLFCLTCLAISQSAQAQGRQKENDSIANARNRITRTAMFTLGSWATANIATGFIAANQTTGQTRYFWRMNVYWNFFNLGIAGLGYWNAIRASSRQYDLSGNLREQKKLYTIYLVNFGLDVVYIGGGIVIHSRSHFAGSSDAADRYAGYGKSIITQGAFLLLMDAVMLHIHHRNTLRLRRRLMEFAPDVRMGH